MILDRNHLDIDKMFLVSNRLNLSDEDLIARPHGMIPVDDVNASKPVEYGDIPRSVELSLKHLEDDTTISTGINPRAQALPTAGTATEAAILKESTLKRIRMKMWLIKKEFLTQIARIRIANILQFYSQPRLEQIVGEKGTQQYESALQRLASQGLLIMDQGIPFKKQYKTIPIEGKELSFDTKGQVSEKSTRGTTFFDLKPEYFLPVARGGYDIRFEAGSTIQISRPLMQSKDLELYDRLIDLAMNVPGSYDPLKLGDMILRSYEKNPDDYKIDEEVAAQGEDRLSLSVDIASMENAQMIKGIEVPATAEASPAHTRVHLAFMDGEQFQGLPNESPIIGIFTQHVVGEYIAQETRAQGGVGGAATPNGQVTQGGAFQGVQNRPGGAAAPASRVSDILPALNTGGNRNLP